LGKTEENEEDVLSTLSFGTCVFRKNSSHQGITGAFSGFEKSISKGGEVNEGGG